MNYNLKLLCDDLSLSGLCIFGNWEEAYPVIDWFGIPRWLTSPVFYYFRSFSIIFLFFTRFFVISLGKFYLLSSVIINFSTYYNFLFFLREWVLVFFNDTISTMLVCCDLSQSPLWLVNYGLECVGIPVKR